MYHRSHHDEGADLKRIDGHHYRRGMVSQCEKEEMKIDDDVLGADLQLKGRYYFEVATPRHTQLSRRFP